MYVDVTGDLRVARLGKNDGFVMGKYLPKMLVPFENKNHLQHLVTICSHSVFTNTYK